MSLTVILIIISFQSPTLSFIPDLKRSFSANHSHCSLSFSSSGLTTWIPQTVYQWRRNYGDKGGTLYPQVQDLYPLYPQVKDAAYLKILSKRL